MRSCSWLTGSTKAPCGWLDSIFSSCSLTSTTSSGYSIKLSLCTHCGEIMVQWWLRVGSLLTECIYCHVGGSARSMLHSQSVCCCWSSSLPRRTCFSVFDGVFLQLLSFSWWTPDCQSIWIWLMHSITHVQQCPVGILEDCMEHMCGSWKSHL